MEIKLRRNIGIGYVLHAKQRRRLFVVGMAVFQEQLLPHDKHLHEGHQAQEGLQSWGVHAVEGESTNRLRLVYRQSHPMVSLRSHHHHYYFASPHCAKVKARHQ